MKNLKFVIFWAVFGFTQIKAQSPNDVLYVCPQSHQYAVSNGTQCCDSEWECSATIPCVSDLGCEDFPTVCSSLLAAFGFPEEIDQDSSFRTEQDKFNDGKLIFTAENNCIWWNRQTESWWIGNCENVGSDNGNASGQGRCPAKVTEWREKWSGNLVENSILLQVGGVQQTLERISASVSIDQETWEYKETCKWKYELKTWTCDEVTTTTEQQ